ncbi:hypothetical protein [Xinfangfangia pollutisoli]|uniref:hypothetical protein n=1 Tax=Xinfangfangia pollutisoli TaxID=2865960 RepID=UPI001CD5AD47|nr:hypothetical protein [Xinfangfangia pollutisoli]
MAMKSDLPPWIGKAWRIRATLMTALLGVIAIAFHSRLVFTGGSPLVPLVPLIFLIVTPLALWADWVWLRRNHHRVNEWGLNRGKDYRKKPK